MADSSRRDFVRGSFGATLGAASLGPLKSLDRLDRKGPPAAGVPLVITSHENETGQQAMREAWDILQGGGSALDAVERGANVIELDPEDMSVGLGGLPNEHGVIQLDASIMDGRTYSAGSVASIENILHPSSVARIVMERTDHVMIVGPAALTFAKSWGFEEQDLMTPRTRQAFLRWRERHSDTDDWGPPEHLVGIDEAPGRSGPGLEDFDLSDPLDFHYGTTNVLAVDGNGDIAGITTTSGLSWKINGRIGDSPIIGAGLYVDNDVGAAGATGRGEDVIKSCASYYVVMQMAAGRSPQQACEDAVEMIVHKYRNVNPDFVPAEKFVAINKDGEYGAAWMGISQDPPQMSVRHSDGLEIYTGVSMYAPAG